jgi:UDP:flavonoid glycosyltransferase YjiC (YdhE family)
MARASGVENLRAAVVTALSDRIYREKTQRLQKEIERTNGLKLAADLIDRKLREAVKQAGNS